jgi:chlorobactene glucosyltransferase
MTVIFGVNMIGFRKVRSVDPVGHPLVSVLVPARNEERTIEGCVSTLVAQDYREIEVLVLDDHSDDATGAIVRSWEARDPRVRLLAGAPLPQGWVGKNYACHQLAEAARGDLLLFVDADMLHTPHAIRRTVGELQLRDAGLLSLIPHLQTRSFWEKAVLPLLLFVTMCFLPVPLVSPTRSSRFAMASGQFMLFRREVYRAIGGHAAVRSAIVEDVWLSRLVKLNHHRLVLLDGTAIAACRMYRSLREIWGGFSKNMFAGFRYSIPAIIAVMTFNALTSVLPFVLLPVAFIADWSGLMLMGPAVAVGILMIIRLMIAIRFRLSVPFAVLHPLGMGVVIAIAANSCRWVIAGGGARWKGRRYDFRRQPGS